MHEVDEVCDRVGIIDYGHLIAEGRPSELIEQAGVQPRLELWLRGDHAEDQKGAGRGPLWWSEEQQDGTTHAAVRPPDGWQSAEAMTRALAAVAVGVIESRLREATLEDAFIALTGSRLEGPFDEI